MKTLISVLRGKSPRKLAIRPRLLTRVTATVLAFSLSGLIGMGAAIADNLNIDFDDSLSGEQKSYELTVAADTTTTFAAPLSVKKTGGNNVTWPATVGLGGGSASWITAATPVTFTAYDTWVNSVVTVKAPATPGVYTGDLKWYSASANFNETPATAEITLNVIASDTTAPVTDISLAGTLGNNGWYTSDVTATLSASDDDSGVQGTEYGFDGSSWTPYAGPFTVSNEGTTTIYYRSTDNADNTEDAKTEEVKIDKTKPAISITGVVNETTYTLGSVPTAGYSVLDTVSGIDTDTASLTGGNGNGVGTFTYSVEATDKAGNTESISVTYYVVYPWSGIRQPINSNGSSIFKRGSTVPVKFALSVGGSAFDSAQATLSVAKVTDSIEGSVTEAASTSAATTGNAFRYDPTSQQYIFNLATKGLETGTYALKIVLDDGLTYTVQISLK